MKLSVSNKNLRFLVLAATLATSMTTQGQTANTPQWQVTAEQRAAASLAAQNGVHISEIREGAPNSYRVQKGDTLWSISANFLKSPWKWPALWGMNQAQVRNPHRIYPGQMLIMVRNGDRATLQIGNRVDSRGNNGATPTVHLTPQVRSTAIEDNAIPVLPPDAVIPFLTHGIVIPRNEFENSPRIVALPERRLLLSVGDKVYVRGGNINPEEQKIYLAYATPEPIRDPVTRDILGFQATYLGKLQFVRAGIPGVDEKHSPLERPATFVITETKQEIRVGDHLTPASKEQELLTDFVPSAAPAGIKGRVVHIYGNAIRHASRYQVVLLSQGHLDGLERGNVVALWRPGKDIRDRTTPDTGWNITHLSDRQHNMFTTPDERYGLAMVFKTYDHLSYAIVMRTTDSVELGDNFTTP